MAKELSKTLRFASVLLPLVVLGGCSKDAGGHESFDKNVESCLCRTLAFEADSFSGISYAVMVKRCNETVHRANPARYSADATSAPTIDALRCPDDVADWREAARDRANSLVEYP